MFAISVRSTHTAIDVDDDDVPGLSVRFYNMVYYIQNIMHTVLYTRGHFFVPTRERDARASCRNNAEEDEAEREHPQSEMKTILTIAHVLRDVLCVCRIIIMRADARTTSCAA